MASTLTILTILGLFSNYKSTKISTSFPVIPPYEREVKYLLYTRANPIVPITLNPKDPHHLANASKIIVIIPGWLSEPQLYYFPELKNEYLLRYDCSVVMVEYDAFDAYDIVVNKVPIIANLVASFLCDVNKKFKISLKKVHVVAHSLGAQLAGVLGYSTIRKCGKKIGRITGLEPAALKFQNLARSKRLDKSDAIFVDVIHTAQPIFSYFGNIGHVDFHVNCGFYQNGCPDVDTQDLVDNLANMFTCHHERAVRYMLESINSNNFIAQSCPDCPSPECEGGANPEYIVMGEDCPKNSTNKVFWIPTHTKSPFGAGCTLYPSGCE